MRAAIAAAWAEKEAAEAATRVVDTPTAHTAGSGEVADRASEPAASSTVAHNVGRIDDSGCSAENTTRQQSASSPAEATTTTGGSLDHDGVWQPEPVPNNRVPSTSPSPSPRLQVHDFSESDSSPEVDVPPRRFLAKRRVGQLLRRESRESDSDAGECNRRKCGFEPMAAWESVRWWSVPQQSAIQPFIERNAALGGLKYRPKRMYNCASTGAELVASRAHGIPWNPAAAVANERLKQRRQFIKAIHGGHLKHLFHSQAAFCKRGVIDGFCDMQMDIVLMSAQEGEYDWISGGPSCRPHTVFRNDKSTKSPEAHKEFDSLFGAQDCEDGSFLGTVETHRPKGGYIEEVGGFAHNKVNDEGMPEISFLDKAAERLAAVQTKPASGVPLYTAIKVVTVGPGVWLKLRRTRTPFQVSE